MPFAEPEFLIVGPGKDGSRLEFHDDVNGWLRAIQSGATRGPFTITVRADFGFSKSVTKWKLTQTQPQEEDLTFILEKNEGIDPAPYTARCLASKATGFNRSLSLATRTVRLSRKVKSLRHLALQKLPVAELLTLGPVDHVMMSKTDIKDVVIRFKR